jgi:3-methyladenine DNA glycosylase/8-oxoguanine DNA glycosylase
MKKALLHLAAADEIMGALIQRVGRCALKVPVTTQRGRQVAFAALVEAVVYQQLTGKAAATILGRVKALYPNRSFPRPRDIVATPDEQLRRAGLSRAKIAAVKDIAAKTLDGTVPTVTQITRMTDDEIVTRLTTIRGVGRWTAEMVLIFMLGRLDVLPSTDYGVRKGFAAAYGRVELPSPTDLLTHGERWRPYRSIASWFLWRAADMKD